MYVYKWTGKPSPTTMGRTLVIVNTCKIKLIMKYVKCDDKECCADSVTIKNNLSSANSSLTYSREEIVQPALFVPYNIIGRK